MDESILLRFQYGGQPMKVRALDAAEGVTFHKPKDASPLNMALGLQALLPGRLDPVRLRHDWRNKEFKLDANVHDDGILLSGFDGDREGLPAGVYDLTVEVESYRFTNSQQRIVVKSGGQAELTLAADKDNRRVNVLDAAIDPATRSLIGASTIDGNPLAGWLDSHTPRAVRQACLLNILTKLAAPPMPNPHRKSLTGRFQSLHFADVDRVYAAADPALRGDLQKFVAADGWKAEGRPKASIHAKLVTDALKRFKPELAGRKEDDFELSSFRQGGRNSLQVVIATPKFDHACVYADLDIDLGNPLWDLDGLFVHLGELLDPSRTDHFDVREKLNQGTTKDFVFYDVTEEESE